MSPAVGVSITFDKAACTSAAVPLIRMALVVMSGRWISVAETSGETFAIDSVPSDAASSSVADTIDPSPLVTTGSGRNNPGCPLVAVAELAPVISTLLSCVLMTFVLLAGTSCFEPAGNRESDARTAASDSCHC